MSCHIRNIIESLVEKLYYNCEEPNYHPETRITRDMAIDAGNLELEGSLYTQEEYSPCGYCKICIQGIRYYYLLSKLDSIVKAKK